MLPSVAIHQRPRGILSLLALVLPAAASLGCGQQAALDVVPVPDPNVNDPVELTQQLQLIKLVLDEPQGSAGLFVQESAGSKGGGQLEDIDSDGKLEFWAEYSVAQAGRIPSVRIEQGSLEAGPIDVQFTGISSDGSKLIASGGVKGIAFAPDQVHQVEVPFNLLPNYRAPQVTQIFPEQDKVLLPGSFQSVVLIFSKRMSFDSLSPAKVVALVKIEQGGQEREIERLGLIDGTLGSELDSPSKVDLQLPPLTEEGIYEVRVSTAAADSAGRRLDQVPLTAGSQGFASRFILSVDADPIADKARDMPQLPTGGTEAGGCSADPAFCPPGTFCEPSSGGCLPEGCPPCPQSAVCDEKLGICVEDCRLTGDLNCPGGFCGPEGLCWSA